MSGIISSATEFFNNTLHSNQYEIKDASKEKIKDIYNKSVDYATMSNRAAIIAKIDLFIQRITHNLWTASDNNVSTYAAARASASSILFPAIRLSIRAIIIKSSDTCAFFPVRILLQNPSIVSCKNGAKACAQLHVSDSEYGTVSHSPCTAAGATGRTSSACSTGRE